MKGQPATRNWFWYFYGFSLNPELFAAPCGSRTWIFCSQKPTSQYPMGSNSIGIYSLKIIEMKLPQKTKSRDNHRDFLPTGHPQS
jgi:hypothetical protein